MKNKVDEIKYKKLIKYKEKPGTVQEFQSSIKFASSFIFVLFSSGALGYYFPKEILGWSSVNSLAISSIVIFLTLVVEILLFIIKASK